MLRRSRCNRAIAGAARAALPALVLLLAVPTTLLARPDPDWATLDGPGITQEKDSATSALRKLEERDLAGAAQLLDTGTVPEPEVDAWSKAVGERIAALRDLLGVMDEASRMRSSSDIWMQLGAAKAELDREEKKPEPTVDGEIAAEEIARFRRTVQSGKEDAAATESAWDLLRSRLASAPAELEALVALAEDLATRKDAPPEPDRIGRYRHGTLEIRLRRCREGIGFLKTGLERWPALLELRDAKRRIAALHLKRDAGLLARMESTFGDQLESRLALARADVARLAGEEPAPEAGAQEEARRRVDVLSARVGAERMEVMRKSVLDWKGREAAANVQMAERLARLRERFADTAGVSARTPELLTSNVNFVRESRKQVVETLRPELKDRLRKRVEARAEVQERLLGVTAFAGGEVPAAGTDDLRNALQAYHDQLNSVVQTLLEIDGLYAARLATLDEMQAFLLGNMYWVRSDQPLGPETVQGVLTEIRRIADAWVGGENQGRLRAAANRQPWRFVLLGAGFLVLIVGGVFLHRRLSAYHTRWRYRGGPLFVIAQRLLANALLSSLAPVLLVLSTLLLELLALPPTVAIPLRILLIGLSIVLFVRRFFGRVFREGGLAATGMHAPPAVAEQFRRASRVAAKGLLFVAIPWQVFRTFPVSPPLEHIPRILYMVLQAWVAFVLVGLLRRRGALIRETAGERGFWSRIAAVLGFLVVLATGFVLVMDGMGYRFGARLLSISILQTFAAGLLLAGTYNLVTSLLDQAARRYRQGMRDEVGDAEADSLAETLSRQVSRSVGVLTIVLTIALLARFWDLGGGIRGAFMSLQIALVDSAAGTWLTGWDVMKALAWITGGHFVVSNLAGILHVLLFSRVPRLQTGTRFAIVSIGKYSILLVSYSAAILSLRISFSSLGWALAAVSLGVGFGLQEIVSNFVSGLILFFERPVRVGDVVTVGTTTGTVERINIRATQILNWDRQVIILPNRKFISEEVVNWTHNDLVMRATIDVGVAYGTDMVRVRQLLFDIVAGHDKARKDPPPRVWFRAFGDSTLDVRIFVFTELEYRVQIVNDLNIEISRRFGEEGIEIAFPQRDLHLRSVQDPNVLEALPGEHARPFTTEPEKPAPEDE